MHYLLCFSPKSSSATIKEAADVGEKDKGHSHSSSPSSSSSSTASTAFDENDADRLQREDNSSSQLFPKPIAWDWPFCDEGKGYFSFLFVQINQFDDLANLIDLI